MSWFNFSEPESYKVKQVDESNVYLIKKIGPAPDHYSRMPITTVTVTRSREEALSAVKTHGAVVYVVNRSLEVSIMKLVTVSELKTEKVSI